MIILDNWFGRLGNNIWQLCNIIDIALFYKHDIRFNVEHKFFDLKIIEEYFNQYKNDVILKCPINFFLNRNYREIYNNKKQNNERNIIKKDLLQKSFLIKDINKLDENDIVVHIRSGDIFTNPHHLYVPPPLSYYIEILNKKKYNKIIIVCEDRVNPVVNKLLELYENSVYTQNTLEEDIKIVLGATNILSSVGTFINGLIRLSNNIKNHYGRVGSDNPKLKDYYLFMKPWKNTPEQRDYILNYEFK